MLTPADARRLAANMAAPPALRAAAWLDLKAGRGQPVNLDRAAPPEPVPLVAHLDAARARTAARVHAILRGARPDTGGAA